MWTTKYRARYDRRDLHYPGDLADREGVLIGPLIPSAKRCGNKRTVDVRSVMNGVMYVLSIGCKWVALAKDLPARSTVNDYFRRRDWDGTLARIHHALYPRRRGTAGRDAGPTAAIIDSKSVKAAEDGGSRATRRTTMPARRSKARSDMSSSTPRAC